MSKDTYGLGSMSQEFAARWIQRRLEGYFQNLIDRGLSYAEAEGDRTYRNAVTRLNTWYHQTYGIDANIGRATDRRTPQRRKFTSEIEEEDAPNTFKLNKIRVMSSYPGGRIPWPTRRPGHLKDVIALKGSRSLTETNFVVQDSNVSITGFTTLRRMPGRGSAILELGISFARYLMKKHYQIEFQHVQQTISQVGGGAGTIVPAQIEFWYKADNYSVGVNGSTIDPVYGTVAIAINSSSSLGSIGTDIATQVLTAKVFGAGVSLDAGGGNIDYEFYGYIPYYNDMIDNIGNSVLMRRGAMVRVENLIVNCNQMTRIRIQNQTANDSGTTSTDTIDQNPVHGRVFYFKNPAPIVDTYGSFVNSSIYNILKLMHDRNGDGIIMPDTTNIAGPLSPLNQLPRTEVFTNVATYRDFSLGPGEIKDFNINFKFDGSIVRFIKGLKLSFKDTPGLPNEDPYQVMIDKDSGAMGTSVLFCFEKAMSNGSNNVKIAYHRNITSTAYVKKNIIKNPMNVWAFADQTFHQSDPDGEGPLVSNADDTTV